MCERVGARRGDRRARVASKHASGVASRARAIRRARRAARSKATRDEVCEGVQSSARRARAIVPRVAARDARARIDRRRSFAPNRAPNARGAFERRRRARREKRREITRARGANIACPRDRIAVIQTTV